jgi:hypothetical protein
MQNIVQCLSFRCPRSGCPPSTLTTYVSKSLNRNICMLMENYGAMKKRSIFGDCRTTRLNDINKKHKQTKKQYIKQ